MIFTENSGFGHQNAKFRPENEKGVKWSPEHQEKHWFYMVSRDGVEKDVFGLKRADFCSFCGFWVQNAKMGGLGQNTEIKSHFWKCAEKGARMLIFPRENYVLRKVLFLQKNIFRHSQMICS